MAPDDLVNNIIFNYIYPYLSIHLDTNNQLAFLFNSYQIGWPLLGTLHSKYKTPWVAILINAIGITLFAAFLPFQTLIEIDIALYSLSLMAEFLALVYLRVKEPGIVLQ